MRQVPKYLIIGNGRMAKHFMRYLSFLEVPYTSWDQTTAISKISSQFERVLLLISDSSIEPFIQQQGLSDKSKLVHFSGALASDLAFSAHPLMTFGHSLYDLDTYRSIPFVLEEGGPSFQQLFPDLPNRHFYVPSQLKPLYHSLCVMSGNFTTLLWQKFFKEMKDRFHIPQQDLLPYMRRTFLNLEKDYQSALTGPFARRDVTTIKKNLTALSEDPYSSIYEGFVLAEHISLE